MSFTSVDFAIFLPIVFLIYWGMPHRARWVVLLAASYWFYMSWNAKCAVLIFAVTLVSYLCALGMERTAKPGRRRFLLGAALFVSLGLLFVFKYLGFALEILSSITRRLSLPLHPVTVRLLLPVGISFYTFQTLSYVIDVYRGKTKAERHFGIYAAFVAFFPQLVAGPIERTDHLLPQIRERHHFSYEQAAYGMKRMVWGYFKKIAVADVLAVYVDQIYNHLSVYSGLSLVLATIFFALQIYCDFSGYSDIAAGTASLMGIRLMTNFHSPYLSGSIREFWSRWHISLSTWFRDYVYIPLGGNRKGTLRRDINLMITFLVSGLWHGASWTFVLWGGIHGLAQVLERHLPFFSKEKRSRTHPALLLMRGILVFLLCCFAWIFFRAESFQDACYVLTHLFPGIDRFGRYWRFGIADLRLDRLQMAVLAVDLVVLTAYDAASLRTDVIGWVTRRPKAVRYGIYLTMVAWILFLMAAQSSVFVYFQF